jgi:hypothetical protein
LLCRDSSLVKRLGDPGVAMTSAAAGSNPPQDSLLLVVEFKQAPVTAVPERGRSVDATLGPEGTKGLRSSLTDQRAFQLGEHCSELGRRPPLGRRQVNTITDADQPHWSARESTEESQGLCGIAAKPIQPQDDDGVDPRMPSIKLLNEPPASRAISEPARTTDPSILNHINEIRTRRFTPRRDTRSLCFKTEAVNGLIDGRAAYIS